MGATEKGLKGLDLKHGVNQARGESDNLRCVFDEHSFDGLGVKLLG